METYRVHLAKDHFTFCAAHFITYAGNVCEPLHGHNYRVQVDLAGELDENQYVVDFIQARDALVKITQELDHRVLLPTEHATIHVTTEGDEVTARFEQRRWVFPASDCVLLPIANTTAELLAQYIGQRLAADLIELCGFRADSMEVHVDECQGQTGICRWAKAPDR